MRGRAVRSGNTLLGLFYERGGQTFFRSVHEAFAIIPRRLEDVAAGDLPLYYHVFSDIAISDIFEVDDFGELWEKAADWVSEQTRLSR